MLPYGIARGQRVKQNKQANKRLCGLPGGCVGAGVVAEKKEVAVEGP